MTTAAERITDLSTELHTTARGWGNGSMQAQDALETLKIARTMLDMATEELAKECRDNGYTWAEIGGWLGITRQAAQQRFGG